MVKLVLILKSNISILKILDSPPPNKISLCYPVCPGTHMYTRLVLKSEIGLPSAWIMECTITSIWTVVFLKGENKIRRVWGKVHRWRLTVYLQFFKALMTFNPWWINEIYTEVAHQTYQLYYKFYSGWLTEEQLCIAWTVCLITLEFQDRVS